MDVSPLASGTTPMSWTEIAVLLDGDGFDNLRDGICL